MPPKLKKLECSHLMQIRKDLIFNSEDQAAALKLGVTVPDKALVQFCLECWSVNPTLKTSERAILPQAGRQLK